MVAGLHSLVATGVPDLGFLVAAAGLVTESDSVLDDIAPIGQIVSIGDVVGVQFAVLSAALTALKAVTAEDGFPEILSDKFFLLCHF